MSRKKFCLDRKSEIVSRDPAHFRFTSLEKFGLLSMLVSSCADGDHVIELERAASVAGCFEATMVLSEARGLWLFLVLREGITCNG